MFTFNHTVAVAIVFSVFGFALGWMFGLMQSF